MLLKLGVHIRDLKRPMNTALRAIEDVYLGATGHEAVITSGTDGSHMPGSLHYSGLAVDVRLPGILDDEVVKRLRTRLGKDYDVVIERTHIHVEYDPKGEK